MPHEDHPTTDTAENRSTEQAPGGSEELLRQITEYIQEVFWVTDPDKIQMLYISPAYEKIWGLTRTSLYREPQSFLQAIHPEDSDRVAAAMPDQVLGNYDEEYRVVQPNGDIRWVRDRAFPIQDDTGQIYRIVGIAEDITDRKLAEEALRESEDRYRQLAELSPEGIMVHTDGLITFANQSMADIFGAESPEQLIGKFALDFATPEERENILKRRKTVDKGGIGLLEEAKFLRADGSVTYVERTVASVIWSGTPSYLVIFRDVNERKRTEEKLHQAQKMEVVGQLTGGVAHDFNNLLTVIHGNLELIAARIEDPLVGRMVENAIKASRRGAELTQRLLAFSRKQTLAPAIIKLDQLVAGMTELMRRTLGECVEIRVAGPDDLWNCKADPGQLENAILNLALNARDAMPRGGTLTIEIANVTLDDTDVATGNDVPPGEYVMVAITDTGTGMSQDVIDHAFEPFFTTKDVGAGSGLGLSMVHGFINQSGGHVVIDSEEGVGTAVTFYLPKTIETEAPVQERPKRENPLSQGEKILVVEDDPDVRALTVNLLAELGYETVEAADGKEAIEMLQRTPGIDLLFTDVGLPGGMSGVEVARKASQIRPGIKLMFTSGYGDDVLQRHGGIGAQAEIVHKPFRMNDLAQKLRTALFQ